MLRGLSRFGFQWGDDWELTRSDLTPPAEQMFDFVLHAPNLDAVWEARISVVALTSGCLWAAGILTWE